MQSQYIHATSIAKLSSIHPGNESALVQVNGKWRTFPTILINNIEELKMNETNIMIRISNNSDQIRFASSSENGENNITKIPIHPYTKRIYQPITTD